MVKRAYKYRFYPTGGQAQLLAQTFGCTRVVYNQILRWRTDAFYNDQQKVNYIQASAKLTELKRLPEFQWLNDVSSIPLQQSLRHQQSAFKNFFEGRASYPKFKSKRSKQSAEFTKSGFKYVDGKLTIAKCKEPLDIRWSREPSSAPSTITITKDCAGRYFVSMLCEFEPKRLPVVNQAVGIDLGITDLFVTDKGEKVGNPRHTKEYADKLAKAQRELSRKALGSKNRAKARIKVARVHAKISDCRQDNLHKLSRRLIDENQVVCVETLKVKNMVRNRSLSKAISDCGWGEFTRQLEYKAEWAGRELVAIDQWFPSSKRCSSCGHTVKSLPLNVRRWQCPECDTDHDRDVNAAVNIKAAGHAVLALGENVSLVSSVVTSSSP
jgi:putative transposase